MSKIVNVKIVVAADNLQISGYVKNLLDDEGLRGNIGLDILTPTLTDANLQNEIRIALPDKRTFGIRASYDF